MTLGGRLAHLRRSTLGDEYLKPLWHLHRTSMAPFNGRPKIIKGVTRSRFSLDRDASADPLSLAIAPEADETSEARVARIAKEEEDKRISDEVSSHARRSAW